MTNDALSGSCKPPPDASLPAPSHVEFSSRDLDEVRDVDAEADWSTEYYGRFSTEYHRRFGAPRRDARLR